MEGYQLASDHVFEDPPKLMVGVYSARVELISKHGHASNFMSLENWCLHPSTKISGFYHLDHLSIGLIDSSYVFSLLFSDQRSWHLLQIGPFYGNIRKSDRIFMDKNLQDIWRFQWGYPHSWMVWNGTSLSRWRENAIDLTRWPTDGVR